MKKSNVKIINFYLTKLFFNKHSISMKIPLGRLSSYYRKKTDDIHTNVMMLKKEKELIYQLQTRKEKKNAHTHEEFLITEKKTQEKIRSNEILDLYLLIFDLFFTFNMCVSSLDAYRSSKDNSLIN